MQISTIGIDIGKNCFHFVGVDAHGGIVVRRQRSRTQLIRALANLPPCLVGMEACCGAHHLGRILIAQGHDVRLIPPQCVKPFVKSQKNDLLDAEAIAEAVHRPTMRFVRSRWYLAVLLVVRTALEDRMLKTELAGHREYANQVHERLLAGLW